MAMYNNSHSSTKGLQSEHASCDKLVLWTSSFDIRPNAKLNVQPYSIDLSKDQDEEQFPLLHDTDGRPIFGLKAYNNNDAYQLSIGRANGSPLLNLQFNPNKVGPTGHYYKGTHDTSQRNAQISFVNDELLRNGIHVDFEGLRLKRADFARDRQLSDPLSAYRSIFAGLSAKRAMTRNYYDTYIIGNGSYQVCAYDKGVESKIPNMVNFGRMEFRATRGRTCDALFGIKTLADVLRTDVETFTDRYKQNLKDKIFSNHLTPNENLAPEIQKICYYIDKYGQSGFGRYMQNSGIPHVMNQFGSVEAVTDVLLQHYSRQAVHKWKKKLSTSYAEHIAYSELAESETARLYNDLYAYAS